MQERESTYGRRHTVLNVRCRIRVSADSLAVALYCVLLILVKRQLHGQHRIDSICCQSCCCKKQSCKLTVFFQFVLFMWLTSHFCWTVCVSHVIYLWFLFFIAARSMTRLNVPFQFVFTDVSSNMLSVNQHGQLSQPSLWSWLNE